MQMWTVLLFLCLSFNSMAQSLPAKVLIYSATKGFRHDSIPTAIEALKANGSSINVSFDNTEDPTQFTDQVLAGYDAVLFLSTTGEGTVIRPGSLNHFLVLDDSGKAAFQKYLNLGGNFIGIHSSSDTLVNTSFYGREIGAYFDYHPALQAAIVDVIDSSHPSTSMLPAEWHVQDEIYNFKSDPRTIGATVVLAANESSYTDNGTRKFDQGTPHPLAWFQEHGAGVDPGGIAGRSFYTSLGHLNETWKDRLFLAHVLGGVQWTLQSNTTRAFNSTATVGNTSSNTSNTTSTSAPLSTSTKPSGQMTTQVGRTSMLLLLLLVVWFLV